MRIIGSKHIVCVGILASVPNLYGDHCKFCPSTWFFCFIARINHCHRKTAILETYATPTAIVSRFAIQSLNRCYLYVRRIVVIKLGTNIFSRKLICFQPYLQKTPLESVVCKKNGRRLNLITYVFLVRWQKLLKRKIKLVFLSYFMV